MSKKITRQQIADLASHLDIEPAVLHAIIAVECRGSGFDSNARPVILFERHMFWRQLTHKKLFEIRDRCYKERPDLCYPRWTQGNYGLQSAQHGRLDVAATYHRESALESASWGLGQIMGLHWQDLGYPSLQSFVNAMYRDEAAQADAMCRFIRMKSLIDELQRKDWAGFALRYNGAGYKANRYDERLAKAYASFG